MTELQKHIVAKLLQGHRIAAAAPGNFRLRDADHNVVDKINTRTFHWLKTHLLRREKSGLYVIDKRLIRSLHGNSIVKKLYKNYLQHGKS